MKFGVFRLLSVYVVLAVVTLCSGQSQCPGGSTRNRLGCFMFSTQRLSWQRANEECINRNLQLLTVPNEDVHNFTADFVRNDPEMRAWDYYWLGAQESIAEWKWIKDGSELGWQGCFRIDDTDLSFADNGYDMTPTRCWQRCRRDNKKYAGMQARRIPVDRGFRVDGLCFCGDRVQSLTVQNNCNLRCDSAEPDGFRHVCGSDSEGQNRNTWLLLKTSSDTSYGRWREGQPNNLDGIQRCMALTTGNEYKWGDEECFKMLRFICQFDYPTRSACTSANSTNKWNVEDKACYRVMNGIKRTWFKAEEECRRQGRADQRSRVNGYLAKITQNLFVQLKKDLLNLPPLNENPRDWWVGATISTWKWIDGSPFDFTNFAPLVPDNIGPACLAVSKSSSPTNYLWDDKGCDEQYNFVCARLDIIPTAAPPRVETTRSTVVVEPPRPTPGVETTRPPPPEVTQPPVITRPATSLPGPTLTPVPSVEPPIPTGPPFPTDSSKSTTEPPTERIATSPSSSISSQSTASTVSGSTRSTRSPPRTRPSVTRPPRTRPPVTRPPVTTKSTTTLIVPTIEGVAASGNNTAQVGLSSGFTNGMIAAVVVVAVAVLVGLIRLGVYCCQRSSRAAAGKDRFDVDRQRSNHLARYDNVGYVEDDDYNKGTTQPEVANGPTYVTNENQFETSSKMSDYSGRDDQAETASKTSDYSGRDGSLIYAY